MQSAAFPLYIIFNCWGSKLSQGFVKKRSKLMQGFEKIKVNSKLSQGFKKVEDKSKNEHPLPFSYAKQHKAK